ncbi:MAG: hypothetical protein ACXWW7_08615, partial [Nocardioides sp.]
PTEPGPTEPGPTEPGPTEPGPTEPGPTEPGPTEPGPTEPGPTEPTPTEPAVVSSDVGFTSQPTFDGTAVTFTIQGSPELPPAINVALSTDPAESGISFGTGGDCPPNVGNPAQATCLTANPLVAKPFMRASTTAVGGEFTATIPLDIPASAPDTKLTITLSVPTGYDDPEPKDNSSSFDYDAPVAPLMADVALDLPSTVEPGEDGTYSVSGTVSGVPADYTGTVTFSLSGKAKLTGSGTAGCATTEGSTLTCASISDGTVDLDLAADDNTAPTDVTVTLAELEGYTDPKPENNSDGSTLSPVKQDESADVSLDLPDSAEPDGSGNYSLAGTVSGIPTGYTGDTVFTLTGDANFAGSATPACKKSDDDTLTCTGLTDGEIDFDLAADDNTGDTPVTIRVAPLESYTDPKQENNGASSTLKAVEPISQMVYAAGPSTLLRAGNSYAVSATVSVIPRSADQIVFDLVRRQGSGTPGAFTGVQLPLLGCEASGSRLTCALPEGATSFTVKFVADLPSGRFDLVASAGGTTVSAPISDEAMVAPLDAAQALHATTDRAASEQADSPRHELSTARKVAREAKTRREGPQGEEAQAGPGRAGRGQAQEAAPLNRSAAGR